MAGGIAYRKDIDGLRTIAVTSVVLYHAGVPWVPAGFVGVDIFFVISGFLITGLLAHEYQASGRVDIAAFYARRVRRLIPALLTMVLASLAIGVWLLPPTGEAQSMGGSAIAALFFSSNLFFYFQPSGYFAQAAESYPLLHTWTLAVEEQFYIVWPLMIPVVGWIAAKLRRPTTAMLTTFYLLVLIISFALCQWAITWRPMAAFYLTPFRAWEFAIGALLALHLARARPSASLGLALSGAGLAAIIAGFALIDPAAAFPGPMALLPVLGTAALIAGGAIGPRSAIARALESAPMVTIGKLSYGWYLWHWPLLAYAHYAAEGAPSVAARTAMVACSLIISAISLHWLETPIRRGRPLALFKATRGALITGAALLVTGAAAAHAVQWHAARALAASPLYQSIVAAKTADITWPRQCQNYQTPFVALAPARECILGAASARRGILLWGDSHAARLVPAFAAWAGAHDAKMLARVRGGCRAFGGVHAIAGIASTQANRTDCANSRAAMAAELAGLRAQGFDRLVIASRWPYGYDDVPLTPPATPMAWASDLAQTIAHARGAGFAVVVVIDNPRFERSVPECLTRHSVRACSTARAGVLARRATLEQALATMPAAGRIDFTDTLCPGATCPPMLDGAVLYSDINHLSLAGSAMLATRAPHAFAVLER
ncbi:MAG: acyltransferase family protein [Sphingopyxis sp.]